LPPAAPAAHATRPPAPHPPPRENPLPPAPDHPEPVTPHPALAAILDAAIAEDREWYGVYVKRLTDNTGASVNQDQVFRTASIFKLYVMWEAVRQESLDVLSFDQQMEVTPYYAAFQLGPERVRAGDSVTVAEALHLMMSVSDTPTAVLLQDTVGWRNINESMRALGIGDSGLFYPESGPLATARDLGVLLEVIERGGVQTPEAHELMRALLLSETIDNGLRSGVPAEVPVAHKTGLLADVRHDAGIVYLEGSPYVIVVLSEREASTNRIPAISRAVYEYYAAGH
ncbi:MAG: serine hydrolase, partial [Dehalococcoidia bacterium]